MTYRPKNTQERLIHRLKISRGHIDRVIKMIEEDIYCIDVLHQLNAVQSGLKSTADVVLENHLKGCVADSIKKGDTDGSIKELMEVFKKSN